jgi:L-seryl-tRNA(Ser) seleniumtransferase
VLADPRLREATTRLGPAIVKRAVLHAQQQARAGVIGAHQVTGYALEALPALTTSISPVINATGIVVHTNLGRAALSPAALAALGAAAGYVDVEFDLGTGRRAPRGRGTLAALRERLPDAGDVLVVNNGAAALLLAVTALGAGCEVIISRGELVEIGDGFRLPELIESAGARIREVGTTNRVTEQDYARAVGPETGCLVKIHPSNFRIEGFTSSVSVGQLSALGPPLVVDVGSGLLLPDRLMPDEPDVTSALKAGADVVTSSADKLLGGPQAGVLAGSAAVIAELRRHPMARALRVDKLTLAALEATLDGPPTPTYQYLHADADQLRARCVALAGRLALARTSDPPFEVVACDGMVGGGGAPGLLLPGWAVALPATYADALRRGNPPVVSRIQHDRCLLDLRCVDPDTDIAIAAAIDRVANDPGTR